MSSRFHESLPEAQGQGHDQYQGPNQSQDQQHQHRYEHMPGQDQGHGHGQGQEQGHWHGYGQAYGQGQGMPFDAQSMNSMSSTQTLVQPGMGMNKVYLTLEQMVELPSVPYKLRHALTSEEWVRRMQIITVLTEKSSHPGYELIYFFIFCIVIPGGIAYPIFRVLLSRNGKIPWGYAMMISSCISFALFILFFTPMLIRKWVIQRRMNRDVQAWARDDQRKLPEKEQSFNVQWRVRLPWVFSHECQITIPIPPRADDAPSLHSRQTSSSSEAAAWGGVPRGDSNTNRSMFENA